LHFIENVSAAIDDLITGKNPVTTKPVFSGSNRNSLCWLHSFDLSFITKSVPHGVAITRKHLIGAFHFAPGSTVTFVDNSNNTITRDIINYTRISVTDIVICELDSELPVGISTAKIYLDPGNTKYLIPPDDEVPCFIIDQDNNAVVNNITGIGSNVSFTSDVGVFSVRNNFAKALVGGDSGSPVFLIVNGEPALMTTAFASILGPSAGWYSSDISVATSPYSITTTDLSDYIDR
jgi:hypothetical protein